MRAQKRQNATQEQQRFIDLSLAFKRKQIEIRKIGEREAHRDLLEKLQKIDGSVLSLADEVESKPHLPSEDPEVIVDSEMDWRNGRVARKDSGTKPEYVADTHVDTWMWWLGFDIDGNWTWPMKARINKEWLQRCDYAMVLKGQRSTLSSQVIFIQMAIVQGSVPFFLNSETYLLKSDGAYIL